MPGDDCTTPEPSRRRRGETAKTPVPVSARSVPVYFNEIGTNQSGTIAIGNSFCGVDVYQASNNVIVYNTIEFSGYFGLINGSATNSYYYNTVVNNGYMNVLTY